MSARSLAPALLALGLAACGGDKGDTGTPADAGTDEDGGEGAAGDGSASDDNTVMEPISDDPLCDGAPVVTWASWGEGFVIGACQACHSATAVDRIGAPAGIDFDTRDEVLAAKDRILARAAGAAPSMPPEGGVLDDDRQLLEIWLTCWE